MRKSGSLVLPLLMAVVFSSFSNRASVIQSPQNLIVPPESETESAITLLWDRPCENDTSLLFLIYQDGSFIDSVKKTHYTVKNLAPGTEYSFCVRSKKAMGEISGESNKVVHSTKKVGQVFDVRSFGAVGDGITLNTLAIQKAIDTCTPGGTVVIPEGTFLSGALFLKSNMTLHIKGGGVLQGSTDPDKYLPMVRNRFEGWELESFASLLNAGELDRSGKYNLTNLTIRGNGVIRGGGEALAKPIIEKFGLRSRGRLICLMNCNNVNVQGLTIEDSPCWTIHYIYSKNISCHDLDISSTAENGDGIDPDSSTDSYIFNCTFNTGDDCIAIKSGKNPEGYYIGKPSENIFISDCNFIDGHSIAIGSEMSGGVNNVVIRDCNSGNLRYGLQVKATKDRGGYVTGLKVSNCMLSRITVFTSVNYNNDGKPAPELPFIRDLEFTNIDMSRATTKEPVIFVDGFEGIDNYTGDIKFANVTIPDNQTIKVNYSKNVQFKNVWSVSNELPVYKITDSENVNYAQKTSVEAWSKAEQILKRIKPLSFPDKVYKVTDFGAVGDGSVENTEPINKAISVCSENGGGVVLIPAGIYKTGAIHLQDNVNLKLSKGAELQFSVNPEDYLPIVETSWEGIRCYNYSPLIYAVDKANVAITGKGVLNGMASNENWWPWKGVSQFGWKEGNPSQRTKGARTSLVSFNSDRTPLKDRVLGPGYFLRPQFIQFNRCSNVLIEGVTIKNSPFWVIHPVFSNRITIREVTVHSMGPNNDGCDPESCKDVLIEDCVFDTGDDCIALKSGRNEDGREINRPIENVIIRNCRMKNGHGGVVIGSEISGGAKNIFAEKCHMDSPQLERAIRIKTNTHRGGLVENIYVRNIKIGEVEESVIRINCKYNPEEGIGPHLPLVRSIHISGMKSGKAKYALWMTGLETGNTIKDIHIEDCEFIGVAKPSIIENVTNLSLNSVLINGETGIR